MDNRNRNKRGQFTKTVEDEEIIKLLEQQNEKVTTEYIRTSTGLWSRGSMLKRLKRMKEDRLIKGKMKGHTWLWWI